MKKKIVRALMATVITASAFGAGTITSHAAEMTGSFDGAATKMISQVFDAKYYAETYPDVVAIFGSDEATLLKHYLTCGIFEGRDASATFNADAYAAANADLATVYDDGDADHIDEYINYFMHYVNCGKTEGRIATIADATAAGITVSSVADSTKVVAVPTLTSSKYVARSGGSSSNGSSYVAPNNNGNSNASASQTSVNTSSSVSNDYYLEGHEDQCYSVGDTSIETAIENGVAYNGDAPADAVEVEYAD